MIAKTHSGRFKNTKNVDFRPPLSGPRVQGVVMILVLGAKWMDQLESIAIFQAAKWKEEDINESSGKELRYKNDE